MINFRNLNRTFRAEIEILSKSKIVVIYRLHRWCSNLCVDLCNSLRTYSLLSCILRGVFTKTLHGMMAIKWQKTTFDRLKIVKNGIWVIKCEIYRQIQNATKKTMKTIVLSLLGYWVNRWMRGCVAAYFLWHSLTFLLRLYILVDNFKRLTWL